MQPPVGNLYNVDEMLLDIEVQERHLGEIADSMTEWEGLIADKLKLNPSDVANIKKKYPQMLMLQTCVLFFFFFLVGCVP